MEIDSHPATKGRPREFCVDAALAAALRVFWSKGYEGASMADLTEAMGITKPSLYAAFGNKEALFNKALDLYEREKTDYMGAALDAPTARSCPTRAFGEGGAAPFPMIIAKTLDRRGAFGTANPCAAAHPT